MYLKRMLFFLFTATLIAATCSCGVVGPAGAVIAGAAAAGGGGGGGGGGQAPFFPLTVSIGPDTPAGATIQYDDTGVLVQQFIITNNITEDVDVDSITLTANGTVDDAADFSAVRLYYDLNGDGVRDVTDPQLGGGQTFSADNGTASFAFAARTIQQGSPELYLVEVDLSGTADHAETFQIGVFDANAQETISSDPVVFGPVPCFGSLFSIQGIAQIEVSKGTNCPSGGGVFEGASNVVMLQMQVKAGAAEAVNLSSVTFTASGTLNDAADITSVELYLDLNNNGAYDSGFDTQIDTTKTYAADNGTVVYTLVGKTLNAGQIENWLVVYDLDTPLTPNDTFQVRLVQSTHISGTGAVTSNPALIVGTPVNGPTMYIQGIGTVTVASATPPANSSVPFAGEWPVLHLTFAAGPNEPVDITGITVNHSASATANVSTDVSQVRLYHDVNENGRYDSYADILLSSGNYSAGSVTFSSFSLVCTDSYTTHAIVQYIMAGDDLAATGRTHIAELDPATDVTARGHDTLQTITPAGSSITGPTMTILRDSWAAVGASTLTARYYHSAVSTGTAVICWGGQGAGYYGNGAIYDPLANSWSSITNTGAPSTRRQHCAVWTGDKMFVWGGYDGSTYLGNGGLYDPKDNSWTTVSSVNAPTSRMDAAAVWTGSRVIVWGGYVSGAGYLDTGGVYNPQANTWTQTDTLGAFAPSERRYFPAAWNGTGMILWGGYNTVSQYLDDGAIYNPTFNSWSSVTSAGAPEERRSHSGVWCGDRFAVFGGYNSTSLYLDTGAYFLGSWTDISTDAPAARRDHTGIWCGEYMIVWGGRNSTVVLQTGGRWNPSGGWEATGTSTTGAPAARQHHTASWAGAGMVIWGGSTSTGTTATATGGRYLP